MAMIQVVRFDPELDPGKVLAWRYRNPEAPARSDELGTWTQLVVDESQEAILFRNGQALDLFGPGRHTLSTANMPLLSKIVNLPFGGESPFKAWIWFVNKVHCLDVKWGTPSPIQLQDPRYGVLLPVRSYGQFGVRIENARKFLVKLVGTLGQFDSDTMVKYFRGLLLTRIQDLISTYLIHRRISIVEVSAWLDEISGEMHDKVAGMFQEYGIEVLNFFVNSINVPEDDPAVAELKRTLTERSKMEVLGYNYQQMRSFDALEKAASNEGGGGMVNAGLGLGIGMGVGGAFGRIAGEMGQNLSLGGKEESVSVRCGKCGAPAFKGAKFCGECGAPLGRTCPACGKVMPEGVKFCPECGAVLVPKCPTCGKEASPGAKFCPECGGRLQEGAGKE